MPQRPRRSSTQAWPLPALQQVIAVVRQGGLEIAEIEIFPNGMIKIIPAQSSMGPESLFDRLEREGKL